MVGRRPYVLSLLGALYGQWGRPAEARRILEELDAFATQHYVRPTYPARIHVTLGEHDEALTLLETAYAERDDHLPITQYDFSFDAIRSERRFEILMKKMGLADVAL